MRSGNEKGNLIQESNSLQKKIDSLNAECARLKGLIAEHERSIEALSKELTEVNDEVNRKIMENGELQKKNEILLNELDIERDLTKKLM